MIPRIVAERITESEGGCWLYGGYLNSDGYGRVTHEDRLWMVHRLVFESLVRAVPEGMQLDHLCNVRRCCKPDHLEVVTHAENVRRAVARRTHCPKGHPRTPETWVSDYAGGHRCLTCRRETNAAHMRRRRAAERAA